MTDDKVIPINENVDLEQPSPDEPMTILGATEGLAGALARIGKKTKTTPEFCLQVYAFFFQQEEAARMRAEQQQMIATAGQEKMDAIAKAHEDLPAEEITSDE